jgi:hypothetical protein
VVELTAVLRELDQFGVRATIQAALA